MSEIDIDMASAQLGQDAKDLNMCKKIVTTMSGDGPQRVVLSGKSGIGKTHLARKVSEHATEEGMCYFTLWLHLNNKFEGGVSPTFENQRSFYEYIAFQITEYNIDEKKSPSNLIKDLKENTSAELSRKKRLAEEQMREKLRSPANIKAKEPASKLAKWLAEKRTKKLETEDFPEEEKRHTSSAVMPYLLLILDDEGKETSEGTVMKDLGLEHFLKDYTPLKVLITRRDGDENTTNRDGETKSRATDKSEQGAESEEEIESNDMDESQDIRSDEQIESSVSDEPEDTTIDREIEFRTTDESHILLQSLTEDNMRGLFASLIDEEVSELLNSLEKTWKTDEPLISCVARKSSCLPAAIVLLSKSLNCIARQPTFKGLSLKQEKLLKEALSPCEPSHSASRCNPILKLAYQFLEPDDTLKNAIIDCFWQSLDFFKHRGSISCNELITQWILEGYFDPVRSVKKAYNDGHDILLELLNRGILKIQEDDMVIPEMAMSNLTDLRHHGLLGRSRLRFSMVYGDEKYKGLGRITQIDDMIKTVQEDEEYRINTILVSGNRLRREKPKKFFIWKRDLQVLGLFSPTVEPLIPYFEYLLGLRVLVIRDYDLLESIEELKCLSNLRVLEVSGASSITDISHEFFTAMFELQSLNLSGLRIKSLPSSISELKELCSLILRDCLVLEDLPDIQELCNLEVLDIRGARKLINFFGLEERTGRNRTFYLLTNLQLLDLSESNIKRLPVFHDAAVAANLHFLTRLLLRNCSNLLKLPNLKPLSGLQILDLSGTTSLLDIAPACFQRKEELKILNLSGTKFTKLPSTISGLSNLRQLLLRDSSNLEALPNIKGLTSLEVFDVSGCTNLHKIEGSFEDMFYLREVNLSGTRIETLPEFPVKNSLCCSKLVVLADSTRLKHDTWSQIKEAITTRISESLSSFDTVDEIQEISRKEDGCVGELWAFDCLEKKGCRREQFYQGHVYMDVYMNTIPFVDTKICQEVLEIQGSNGISQDKDILAKVESVAIVDNSAESLSSIFKELKSVKSCWLEMCGDIKILFSGVDEERLENLETLSITNLRLLESICSSSFKNLKNLSLDCCPCIETLFPASALPTSLEVLKIKFCEKLEKLFEQEVEVPNLRVLCLFNLPVLSAINAMLPNLKTYKPEKCPQLEITMEDLCGPGSRRRI